MKYSNVKAIVLLSFSLFFFIGIRAGQKWSMNGNSASVGDFIGTTTNYPLIFKANNAQQMTEYIRGVAN